jgi:hypothetical protein
MVWDRPWTITIHQKSKSVWIAVGEYMERGLKLKTRLRQPPPNAGGKLHGTETISIPRRADRADLVGPCWFSVLRSSSGGGRFALS